MLIFCSKNEYVYGRMSQVKIKPTQPHCIENVHFMISLQYTLSAETVNYLKQPTFDIWHWEANEVRLILSTSKRLIQPFSKVI